MSRRDVATIVFRAMALGPILTGLAHLLETLIGWDSMPAQIAAQNQTGVSPEFLRTSMLAGFGGRVAVGVVFWFAAAPLSRLCFREETPAIWSPEPQSLYRVAAFAIGLWMLASALPEAAYLFVWAVRTGWRPLQDAESASRLSELLARATIGGVLLRTRLFIPSDIRGASPGAENEEQAG